MSEQMELKTTYSDFSRLEDIEALLKQALKEIEQVKATLKRNSPAPKEEKSEPKKEDCPFEAKGILPAERDYYLKRFYQGRTFQEMDPSTKDEVLTYILEGHDEHTRDILGDFTQCLMEIENGTIYTDSQARCLFIEKVGQVKREHLWGLVKMMRMCKAKVMTAKK